MAFSTITSSTGNRDLDAGYTVSLTNSGGSGDCRVELAIGGASTNQLHTDGQTLTLTFKIDGRFVNKIEWEIPASTLKVFRPATPIYVGTGKALTILIESDNSSDTAVEVAATLLDAQLLDATATQSAAAAALTAYDPPTKAELDSAQSSIESACATADVSGLATQSSVDTIDANVDSILADTGTTLPSTLATIAGYLDTEIAAIKSVTDQFVFTVSGQVDANALSGGGSGGGDATAENQTLILAALGDVPSAAEIREEMDSNSTQLQKLDQLASTGRSVL